MVAERLADRVDRWATLNEPWCSAFLGYAAGVHAPGVRDPAASLGAAYHLMLGHGLAVQRLRAAGARHVGVVLNLIPVRAEDDASAAATRYVDGLQNRFFLDLLAGRGVPADVREATRSLTDWSFVRDGDGSVVGAPIDWLGENYYTVLRVAAGTGDVRRPRSGHGRRSRARRRSGSAPRPPLTDTGWEIEPSGLGVALRMIEAALPGVPVWVTENGTRSRTCRPRTACATRVGSTTSGAHVDELLRGEVGRRGRARVLRLVAAGQPRVGRGLDEAVRHRPGRAGHADPRPQGQCALVARPSRRPHHRHPLSKTYGQVRPLSGPTCP